MNVPGQLLLWAAVVGMSAAAVPPVVRALDVVQRQMMKGRKPWICDLCMSFWSTAAAACFWTAAWHAPLIAGAPAFVVTYALVRWLSAPTSQPPMPELQDSDEDDLQVKVASVEEHAERVCQRELGVSYAEACARLARGEIPEGSRAETELRILQQLLNTPVVWRG